MAIVDHQCRHWCFTWNDFGSTWSSDLLVIAKRDCKHYAFQMEQAPLTGKLHIQGYMCFGGKGLRLSAVKHLIVGAHWERAMSPPKAWLYCQKDDTCADVLSRHHCDCAPPEATDGLAGSRWSKFKEYCVDHDCNACFDAFPDLVKNIGAMRAIYERKIKKDYDLEKHVVCIWGAPGMGKTYTVKEMMRGKDFYRKDCTNRWWDGYSYESVVWLDDMQPKSGFSRSTFLQLLDRGVVQGEIKGGVTTIIASEIYITSNYDPVTWFEKGESVVRRIERMMEVSGDGAVSEVRQQQGNTVPAVAAQVQKSIFEMMKKKAAAAMEEDESTSDEVKEVKVDNEMFEMNYVEAKEYEEKMKRFQLMSAVGRLASEVELEQSATGYFSEEDGEEAVFTAKKLKRCGAVMDLSSL